MYDGQIHVTMFFMSTLKYVHGYLVVVTRAGKLSGTTGRVAVVFWAEDDWMFCTGMGMST